MESIKYFGLSIEDSLISETYILQILSYGFSIVIFDIIEIIAYTNVPTLYRNLFLGMSYAISSFSFYISILGVYINDDNYFIIMLTSAFLGGIVFMSLEIKVNNDYILRDFAETQTNIMTEEDAMRKQNGRLNFKKSVLGKIPVYVKKKGD